MGIALANELHDRGATVSLVLGPADASALQAGIELTKVRSAKEMLHACLQIFPSVDAAILTAAVADYRPLKTADHKIKKKDESMSIPLERTDDILSRLGKEKKKQVLAGFALETHDELAYAIDKLEKKKLDFIVLNSLNDPGAGFGVDTNKVTIIEKNGEIAYI